MPEPVSTRSVRSLSPPTWFAIALIALAGLAAYSDSFQGAFVFDDPASIVDNLSIHKLWPLGPVLHPPTGGLTVDGRPLLNLSLAINYAISGTRVGSYHVFNLAIHILAALTLFGIVRRTLKHSVRLTLPAPANAFALAVALLWVVHPIQTESVTYVVQRAESLMGLFYLLTLYCFIRGAASREGVGSPGWLALSCLVSLAGMASKEVMASAPLAVFFYDAVFLTGGFKASFRRRWPYWSALAASLGLLGYLVLSAHGRGGTSGFELGMPWMTYFITQFPAAIHYLKLSFWPSPLVFDYAFDRYWIRHPWVAAPAVVVIVALAILSAVCLWKKKPSGFLGFVFFAILAPTSLIPGLRQYMAEHRMYLALAPVLVAVLSGIVIAAAWWERRRSKALPRLLLPSLVAIVAVLFGCLTYARNHDYRTDLTLWADTAQKIPDNPYAINSYGSMLFQAGRYAEARDAFNKAIQIFPGYPEAHGNLGCVLEKLGLPGEAIVELGEAIKLKPESPKVHVMMADVLSDLGESDQAVKEFAQAYRLDPNNGDLFFNWGNEELKRGDLPQARKLFENAIRVHPEAAEAHNNLANTLAEMGLYDESAAESRIAVQLKPQSVEAHNDLGITLYQLKHYPEALAEFEIALRLDPNQPTVHNNCGNVLKKLGRKDEARTQYEEALRLKPDYVNAQQNLDLLLGSP